MPKQELKPIDNEKLIEIVFWFIKRNDNQRYAISNRAAIVLSADALLLAGIIFLIDKLFSGMTQYTDFERVTIFINSIITFVFLISSLITATTGIANVWKKSYQWHKKLPKRLLFYARPTIETFNNFSDFRNHFKNINYEQLLDYGITDFWVIMSHLHRRYQKLRWSIRLLTFSLIPFSISFCILLLRLI